MPPLALAHTLQEEADETARMARRAGWFSCCPLDLTEAQQPASIRGDTFSIPFTHGLESE